MIRVATKKKKSNTTTTKERDQEEVNLSVIDLWHYAILSSMAEVRENPFLSI